MSHVHCIPGDPSLVDQLVYELKSKGIFDQFRKECIADVDTKPAYQNLRQRVESSVSVFLSRQRWKPEMNKNQLREKLRKHILDGNYLEQGVERIVDQVVNPKVASVFIPQVEDLVYNYLGIPRKKEKEEENGKVDLLPEDLEAVSPESVKSEDKEEKMVVDQSEKEDTQNSDINMTTDNPITSLDALTIPLPAEGIKLDSIPRPDVQIDIKNIDLPHASDIPLPNATPPAKDNFYKSTDDDSSSDSSLMRNMSPITPVRNFDDDSCHAQEPFEAPEIKKDDAISTFRFTIENETKNNDKILSYQFENQVNIEFNPQEDSSNSNNLQIDYESDASKTNLESKLTETDSKDSRRSKEDSKSKTSRHSSSKKSSSSKEHKDRNDKKSSSDKKHRDSSTDKDRHRHSSHKSSHRDSKSKSSSSSSKSRSSRDKSESKSDKPKSDRKKNDKDDKKKDKKDDDHYNASGRNNHKRRSTDRDSNDGNSSSSKGSNHQSAPKTEAKSSKSSSTKSDNPSTDNTSPSDKEVVQSRAVNIESRLEIPIAESPIINPEIVLKKPKIAENFEEARTLSKMRKLLDEEQRKMNQEAALLLEFHANVRPSLSQVYSSISGPELEFACIDDIETEPETNKAKVQEYETTELDKEHIITEIEDKINKLEEEELKYFTQKEIARADLNKNKFSIFLTNYLQNHSLNKNLHLIDCDAFTQELLKKESSLEVINIQKTSPKIVKDFNIVKEVVIPEIFSPKSECSFELSDYDAKLEEMVNRTSRQEVMEIILGGVIDDGEVQIGICNDSQFESVDRCNKRKLSGSNDNNNYNASKIRKINDIEQITSTTDENIVNAKTLNSLRSKYLGKARRVGLSKPKRTNVSISPTSDTSVENYDQSTEKRFKINGQIKKNSVQRYDTKDLYKPKLSFLKRNNVS